MEHPISEKLRRAIRQVPDFPKPGINFCDLTTVLKDAHLFREVIDLFYERYKGQKIDAVVGIEARGFILGSPLAYLLKTPFIPVRKPGKLPAETVRVSYSLEYGEDSLEIHKDALTAGQRVVVVDDLLATGGTAKGTVELCQRVGAAVVECCFVMELSFIPGRQKLAPTQVISLVKYSS